MTDDEKTIKDALAMARLNGLSSEAVERSVLQAEIAISKMVIGEVVTRYTLIEQLLNEIIATYFLNIEPLSLRFSPMSTERERIFSHHILDEMYLLKKLDLVHAIGTVPSDITSTCRKLNAVRNALTHSFFPQNRKEYKSSGKVLYGGIDIRTPEGLEKFEEDTYSVVRYLHERGPGLGAGID
jgi:hypothetical protein